MKRIRIKDKTRFEISISIVFICLSLILLGVHERMNPRISEEEFLNSTYLETPSTTESAVSPQTRASVEKSTPVPEVRYSAMSSRDAAKLALKKKHIKSSIANKVLKESERRAIRADLIFSIIQLESEYKAKSINPSSGATGLMQVMEETYYDMNPKGKHFRRDMLNPYKNIETGTKTLHVKMEICKGDLYKALCSYGGAKSKKAKKRYMRQLAKAYESIYHRPFSEVMDEIEMQWNIKHRGDKVFASFT